MITVEPIGADRFRVVVEGAATTTHTVTVSADYCTKLTGGRSSAEVLIERSFEFLLQRESNTSILRRFDLPVIGEYFPEYERIIKHRLS
ncbi:MAG: hypothetical protein ACE5K1_03360 [Acidiferrobacterales bacterium]